MTLGGILTCWKAKAMIPAQGLLLRTLGKAKLGSSSQRVIQEFSKRLVGGYPYIIKLDVIDSCNLKCKMCYANNQNADVSLQNILSIIKQIRRVPVRLDLLGGEPLLREDITEVIRFAKTHTATKEIVLYTNGILATEKLARGLQEAGLDKAIVTFISHNPRTHDALTGINGSWEQTIAGIKNLLKAGIKTYTFTAVHTGNIMDIEEIYAFVRKKLAIPPLFFQYVPQSRNDPLLPSAGQWGAVKNRVLGEYSPKHFEQIKDVLTFCGRVCLGGYYVISIKADGSVSPCPFTRDICLGNALKENIWDIFARRYHFVEFREFMKLPEECGKCSCKELCGGGCKAGNKILSGNYSGKDFRCLGPWREQITEKDIYCSIPDFF